MITSQEFIAQKVNIDWRLYIYCGIAVYTKITRIMQNFITEIIYSKSKEHRKFLIKSYSSL